MYWSKVTYDKLIKDINKLTRMISNDEMLNGHILSEYFNKVKQQYIRSFLTFE